MEQQVTETTTVTTRAAGIRYGLIGAVVSILFFLVLTMAGLDMQSSPWSWINYLIIIALIVLAHKYYKDNNEGYMSYGQGIGIAFWMSLVSTVIGTIFTYIYIKFVDTTFMEKAKDKQIEKMQEQGMSEDQIDQAMSFSEMFFKPEMVLVMGIIGGIIITVIIALIVSIFTQKKGPEQAF